MKGNRDWMRHSSLEANMQAITDLLKNPLLEAYEEHLKAAINALILAQQFMVYAGFWMGDNDGTEETVSRKQT